LLLLQIASWNKIFMMKYRHDAQVLRTLAARYAEIARCQSWVKRVREVAAEAWL
jgi:hypothetical protein